MYASVAPRPQLYEGTTSLNPPGYSASKAALLAFTRYTASFWGREGVRANCISPGPFSNTEDAEGQNSVAEDSPFVQRLKGYTVLNRIGRPIELCGALLFLASDASTLCDRAELQHRWRMDGGLTQREIHWLAWNLQARQSGRLCCRLVARHRQSHCRGAAGGGRERGADRPR